MIISGILAACSSGVLPTDLRKAAVAAAAGAKLGNKIKPRDPSLKLPLPRWNSEPHLPGGPGV